MAFNKKKSRSIIIDDACYRYIVSTSKQIANGQYKLSITIQHEESNGSPLCIDGLVTRDFWLDISDRISENGFDYPVITPQHIAGLIQRGIADGWQPRCKGKSHQLKVRNEDLLVGNKNS